MPTLIYSAVQDLGYTPDFVQSLAPLLRQVKASGLKIVSNAGGINPPSCVEALQKAAKQSGVNLSIATVTGDDLLFKVVAMMVCVCVCVHGLSLPSL